MVSSGVQECGPSTSNAVKIHTPMSDIGMVANTNQKPNKEQSTVLPKDQTFEEKLMIHMANNNKENIYLNGSHCQPQMVLF